MTFVIGSYQAVEHPGGGHRASAAGLWRGVDLRLVNEVAMTVLPADCADAARLAVESVAAIRHPHLLPVLEVSQDDDRVAVVCPWPAGGRLAELVIRRTRLTVGETLTVLIPLADALAEVHAAGIRHGEVCPEAVWFDANGRPLLGAPAVSRLIAELNDGLPAGSRDVAPEVIRGDKFPDNSITPAADIFSLGSVALFCLTGRPAWPADDAADVLIQSAAGLWPDLPDEAGPPAMVAMVREMLRADAGRRPSAADLSARLGRVGEPSPITFGVGPAPTPASADRWRGWSAAGPHPEAEESPIGGRQGRTSGLDDEDDPDSGPADGRLTDPRGVASGRRTITARRADSGRPATPGRSTPVAKAGIALLVGLLVTVVAVQIGLWWTGWEDPTSTSAADVAATAPPDPSGMTNWSDVVIGLDAARGRALDAADPALLADVYLDSTSAAGAADAAVVTQLADNGLRVVDGVHQIVSVTVDDAVVDGAEPVDPASNGAGPVGAGPIDAVADRAMTGGAEVSTAGSDVAAVSPVRLAVVDTLPAHPIVDATGRQVGLTPARAEQRHILVLTPTGNGYRISRVEPG